MHEAGETAAATRGDAGELIEDELTLRSADGTPLHVRRVRPAGGARARLLCVHGFAEHGGRYGHVLRFFAARGYEAAVLDLRGHGRSGGRRTWVRRFDDYLDDLSAYWRQLGEGTPRLPLLALAHSMGGLVLLRTLQARGDLFPGLLGAAASSPFLAIGTPLPAWKVVMGKGLSRVWPAFRLPSDLDTGHLSRDPAVGAAYLADPLVVKSATSRWFTEVLAAQQAVFADAARVRVPLLLQHGSDDRLVDPAATERLAGLLRGPCALRVWPSLRHELMNEPEREEVLGHLLGWFEERLGSAS